MEQVTFSKVRDLLPLDQYISHDVSEDVITVNGIIRVTARLKDEQYTTVDGTLEYLPPLPRDWDWSWVGRSGDYRGKIANRIETYYSKEHGIKIDKNLKTMIGSLLSDNRLSKGTYHFDFTDKFDWEAGDFADGGSCYWGSRQTDRWSLESYGALAVRFYSNDTFEEGTGRAWMVVDDPAVGDMSIILFNGYSQTFGNPTHDIAGILAHFLGMNIRSISITNRDEDDGSIYFNGGGSAVLVAPPNVLSNYSYKRQATNRNPFPTVDFNIPTNIIGRCVLTNEYIKSEDWHYKYNNRMYSKSAYETLFSRCEISGKVVLKEDLRELPDGRMVHVDEYNKLLSPCHVCKGRHLKEDLVWLEGSSVLLCAKCKDEHTVVDVHSGALCLLDTTCVINDSGDRIEIATGYEFSVRLDENLSNYMRNVDNLDVSWLEQAAVATLSEMKEASVEDFRLALCDALLRDSLSYSDIYKNISKDVAYGMVGYFNITALVDGIV